MPTLLRKFNFALLLVMLLQCIACSQSVEVRGTTMGTIPFRVLVVTDDHEPEQLTAIKNGVNNSLQRVNELMSTYIEESDISKFNRTESTDWVTIDAETATVVAKSLEISKLTDGAFDPTVGPAVNAWNFGPGKRQQPEPPSDERIAELKKIVGYQKIDVRSDPPAVRKSDPEVQLDLSAIAKGYAVDRVGKTLGELGYENYMVVVGGEVYARGERASGGPWNVAVEKPENSNPMVIDENRVHRVVKLSGRAIATSGDYRNFFEYGGKRYSHTINPLTCKPVNHELAIASIVADDCMTADAMATAVMVMGRDKGAEACSELGYPLLTVERVDGETATFETNHSDEFPLSIDHLEEEPKTAGVTDDDSATQAEGSIIPVFVATFVVFCLMVLGMAVGAIFNNKPVTGSCGGIANMTNEDGDSVCGICSKPTMECPETQES